MTLNSATTASALEEDSSLHSPRLDYLENDEKLHFVGEEDDDPNSVDTTTQDSTQGTQQHDKEKDVGDAFELIFIAGHVAIKQIVFLELVERDWKRQNDEKQAGRSLIHPM